MVYLTLRMDSPLRWPQVIVVISSKTIQTKPSKWTIQNIHSIGILSRRLFWSVQREKGSSLLLHCMSSGYSIPCLLTEPRCSVSGAWLAHAEPVSPKILSVNSWTASPVTIVQQENTEIFIYKCLYRFQSLKLDYLCRWS